jgi:hypothetical protein
MTARSPIRRRSSAAGIPITVAMLVAPTGCARPDTAPAASACAEAVVLAAAAIDIDEQKAHLDSALLQCRSLADLGNEIARHPGLLGHGVERFVEARCTRIDDEAVLAGPVCAGQTSTTPATSIAPADDLPVFVGDTLDGRRIELRPGPTIRFVGDVPEVVQQTVDIATESGCPGVAEQRARWFALVGDPIIGDEASVYTRHADNVAAYLGCEPTPPATTVPDPNY